MVTRAHKIIIPLALLILLVVGLGVRLYDLNWDENHHIHPDERWITMVAMDTYVPAQIGDALNPRRSTLNPYWNVRENQPRRFAYGSFPLYLVRLTATGISAVAASDLAVSAKVMQEWRTANDYDHINLVGRILSALFDTLTILLVFLLGKRLYNEKVGLLAAAFVAFAVQHIQLSHFYAFDGVTTTVIVAAVYFGARVVQDGRTGDTLWLGAMVALAVASKFSALPLLLVVFLAHALRPIAQLQNARAVRPADALGAVATPPLTLTRELTFEINRAVVRILLCVLFALLVFFVVSPFTFLDFNGYTASIGEQSDMVRGVADFPYTRQYRNTGLSYWFENWIFWAVGPALGVSALAGLLAVGWRVARRRASSAELLMLAWVVPYAAITLSFQVKFLRYLQPITPFMALMAAYLLWRVQSGEWRALKRFRAPRGAPRIIFRLLTAVVLLATIAHTYAFLSVYSGALTRVTASEWIYRNIPAGKALTDESWDDSLPFARIVDGLARVQGDYRMVTMHLHEPDDARKLENLRAWLKSADYVVISSNRMYGWLPRLAERFPIIKRYYELLFAEQLGFKRAAIFTSYPRIGSLDFNDDTADESFTVYDHPKVLIFQKTRNLSDAEFNALFADVPPAKQPSASAPVVASTRDRTLLLDRPVDQLPEVNDRAWNQVANESQALAVIWWWLVVQIVGVLALPLTLTVFHRFADGGYIIAKSLGLLVVAYLMWILASLRLLMHHALAVWVITLVLLGLSLFALVARREQFLAFVRARKRLILFEEALFACAFAVFIFIRMLNPDLWQPWNGGEKFMEFAFLNAILKSPYFPPYDPYFAGGYINYYYYGIYVVGILVKLTGVASEVAFNLAIPTLFALTGVNAFSIAFNLTNQPTSQPTNQLTNQPSNIETPARSFAISPRAILSGLLALLFVTTLGNLDGIVQIVEGLGKAGGSEFKSGILGVEGLARAAQGVPAVLFEGKALPAFDYWRSSRVIPFTINEFPLWSFLFADLHPHMIGIPFTVVAIALAAHTVLGKRTVPQPTRAMRGAELDGAAELRTPIDDGALHLRGVGLYVRQADNGESVFARLLYGITLALTLGAIAAINTWDAPTYLGLTLGALLLKSYWAQNGRWLGAIAAVIVVGLASIALYSPFFSHYKALYVGLGFTDIHTEFQPFVSMWGFLMFTGLTFIAGEIARRGREDGAARPMQIVLRHFLRLPRLLDLAPGAVSLQSSAFAVLLLFLAGIALLVLNLPVAAVLLYPFTFSALLLLRRRAAPRALFATWLAFWAFAILLGVEVVYLQDFLGGEWKRMNTLFKFYIQVWVLLALLAAIALPELWMRVSARRGVLPALWQTALLLFVGSSLIFTFAGTSARTNDRFPSARPPLGTLDGLAYMSVATYNWPDERNRIEMKYDLDAIRWLQNNVSGTPIIAEAAIGYYREGGMRVSSYTGLPTLLGMHQSEQRYGDDVGRRDGETRDFFNTFDSARAMDLIRRLRIRYIYIGQLEQITYDRVALEKFETMVKAGVLDVAYRNPKVVIYRVKAQ